MKPVRRLECRGLLSVFRIIAGSPVERAGLLIGAVRGDRAICHGLVMVRNLEDSPVRFTMDPWGIVVAHKAAWNLGLDVVGVFHTHPCGEPAPSPIDVRFMRLWPMPWVISSPRGVGAWILGEDGPVRLGLG